MRQGIQGGTEDEPVLQREVPSVDLAGVEGPHTKCLAIIDHDRARIAELEEQRELSWRDGYNSALAELGVPREQRAAWKGVEAIATTDGKGGLFLTVGEEASGRECCTHCGAELGADGIHVASS